MRSWRFGLICALAFQLTPLASSSLQAADVSEENIAAYLNWRHNLELKEISPERLSKSNRIYETFFSSNPSKLRLFSEVQNTGNSKGIPHGRFVILEGQQLVAKGHFREGFVDGEVVGYDEGNREGFTMNFDGGRLYRITWKTNGREISNEFDVSDERLGHVPYKEVSASPKNMQSMRGNSKVAKILSRVPPRETALKSKLLQSLNLTSNEPLRTRDAKRPTDRSNKSLIQVANELPMVVDYVLANAVPSERGSDRSVSSDLGMDLVEMLNPESSSPSVKGLR